MSQDFLVKLADQIQYFADHQTNPVLEVLAGEVPSAGKKYPQHELHFDNDSWRGFYHCHDSPGKDKAEHGHFHLFTRVSPAGANEQAWSHIVALSMDYDGQPIAWFTVNQWVTSGAWEDAGSLCDRIEPVSISGSLTPTEQWLLAMVGTYRQSIVRLLYERDQALIEINEDGPDNAILQDREIYQLSYRPVNLANDLFTLTHAS